jgi:hypothetical protein
MAAPLLYRDPPDIMLASSELNHSSLGVLETRIAQLDPGRMPSTARASVPSSPRRVVQLARPAVRTVPQRALKPRLQRAHISRFASIVRSHGCAGSGS